MHTRSVQELRKGKYTRTNSNDPDVLGTIVQLGVQVEGTASHAGVVLLPPTTVEALLVDKRRTELVQSFRLAMLKLASQVRACIRNMTSVTAELSKSRLLCTLLPSSPYHSSEPATEVQHIHVISHRAKCLKHSCTLSSKLPCSW